MPANAAQRASDGRRSRNRAYSQHAADMRKCRTSYLTGTGSLELVVNRPPQPKLVYKQTPVLPGLLSVGKRTAIFAIAPHYVTFAGVPRLWSLNKVNEVITLYRALKVTDCLPRKCEVLPAKAESTPLLPAQCPTAKKATEQVLVAVA